MARLLLAVACCVLVVSSSAAQGFRAFSGRNHPEITWLTAETDHFVIVYPEHLAGIESEAAAVAEDSYRALSANLEVTFDRPIRIYLSDEDEITNGFAVPIGNGFTNIWVHVNDVAEVWTGEEKWLRKVIAHELAHIFHFRAVRSNIGLWQYVVTEPLPRFWAEGLAQYLTEDWDAQRGDRWLRTAVLDGRLSYTDGQSMWNGRLMYAIGNSQVRYFAEQYGDSTLAEMLRHRRPALLGLARVHDFQRAFREATGKSHREFYDDWRRHVNVYYNTMAGQLENADSLDVPPMGLPGQYLFDVSHAPDTGRVAILSLESLSRPIRRLILREPEGRDRVLADGTLKAPISWSADGRFIAMARTMRGNFGALINDIVLIDAERGTERRLTNSRRASAPAFDPRTGAIAFAGVDRQTANVFELDPATGEERQLTFFEGDVQIAALRWDRAGERLAIALFDEEGRRDIHVFAREDGTVRPLVASDLDDRDPVWSPDGQAIAFTSFRDDVPNVYVLDLETDSARTVTRLATGARVHDWLPADPEYPLGRLVIVSGISKERDRAFAIDAARDAGHFETEVPPEYEAWTAHRPPHLVPQRVEGDESLIRERGHYNSWKNITHAASIALPYYVGSGRWGLVGTTSFVEPLGKHGIAGIGALALDDVSDSWFVASYINNQWYPTITTSFYRFPGSVQIYGDEVLAERFSGGDVMLRWPLDWRQRPFTSTEIGARARFISFDPLNVDRFVRPEGLPEPRPGEQLDVQVEIARRTLRPYRHNVVHPLDGHGIRLRLTAAAPVLGTDLRFVEGDLRGYVVLPSLGRQRLFLYGRAQAREGTARPQDYIGLSRYDDVVVPLPSQGALELGGRDRVRGYNSYVIGNRVLFGSAEYRIPLLPDLQTRLLGLVSLGATTGALFVDAAVVWSGNDISGGVTRAGAGSEIKNALRIGGLDITHSVGIAQPIDAADVDDPMEVYYRVRAAIPF